jgi:hypothetical protein
LKLEQWVVNPHIYIECVQGAAGEQFIFIFSPLASTTCK